MVMSMSRPTLSFQDLDDAKLADEREAVLGALRVQALSKARASVRAEAEALVRGARRSVRKQGVVESFLQEFSLGTREGLALMCLARPCCARPTTTPATS